MKKIIFILSLIVSTASFANVCADIQFETQDFLCTLESKNASDLAGTNQFQRAIREKMNCLNSFSAICESNLNSSDLCAYIRFDAQESICTLEAFNSSQAAGTSGFQRALQLKWKCLESFSQACKAVINQ